MAWEQHIKRYCEKAQQTGRFNVLEARQQNLRQLGRAFQDRTAKAKSDPTHDDLVA